MNFTKEQKIGQVQTEMNIDQVINLRVQAEEMLGMLLNTDVYFQELTIEFYGLQEDVSDVLTVRALAGKIKRLKGSGRKINTSATGVLDRNMSLLFLLGSEKELEEDSVLIIGGVEAEISGTAKDIEEALIEMKEHNKFILGVLKKTLNESLYRKCERAINAGKTIRISANELFEANLAIVM